MPISNLLADLIEDIRDPGMLWQVFAIAVCMALGWAIARQMRAAFSRRNVHQSALAFGVQQLAIEHFARMIGPLLMLALLAGAKWLLAKWFHVNLLRLALPLFASFAVIRTSFFLLRRVFARQGQVGAAILTFEKIFALLVWLAVALYITGMWPEVLGYLEETSLPLGRNKVSLAAILQGAISVVVLLMLALWAGAALEDRLMKVQGMHSSLRVVTARLGRAVLIVVAVLLSLSMVGIDLTVLSVFGGALGVGLGLGLQKIASNYVSGFVILLERGLAIGDMITVDKYYGQVTKINTRYTVLRGLDGIESVLPNEMLVSGAVQNHSNAKHQLHLSAHLTVTYDSDLRQLLPLLEQVAGSVPRVLADPAPGATLIKFGPDGLELEVGFWIADPENGRSGVVAEVNKKIWEMFESGHVKMAYPMRDTRFVDERIAAVLAGAGTAQNQTPGN
jgi:small-conductance mechanosensitive channel